MVTFICSNVKRKVSWSSRSSFGFLVLAPILLNFVASGSKFSVGRLGAEEVSHPGEESTKPLLDGKTFYCDQNGVVWTSDSLDLNSVDSAEGVKDGIKKPGHNMPAASDNGKSEPVPDLKNLETIKDTKGKSAMKQDEGSGFPKSSKTGFPKGNRYDVLDTRTVEQINADKKRPPRKKLDPKKSSDRRPSSDEGKLEVHKGTETNKKKSSEEIEQDTLLSDGLPSKGDINSEENKFHQASSREKGTVERKTHLPDGKKSFDEVVDSFRAASLNKASFKLWLVLRKSFKDEDFKSPVKPSEIKEYYKEWESSLIPTIPGNSEQGKQKSLQNLQEEEFLVNRLSPKDSVNSEESKVHMSASRAKGTGEKRTNIPGEIRPFTEVLDSLAQTAYEKMAFKSWLSKNKIFNKDAFEGRVKASDVQKYWAEWKIRKVSGSNEEGKSIPFQEPKSDESMKGSIGKPEIQNNGPTVYNGGRKILSEKNQVNGKDLSSKEGPKVSTSNKGDPSTLPSGNKMKPEVFEKKNVGNNKENGEFKQEKQKGREKSPTDPRNSMQTNDEKSTPKGLGQGLPHLKKNKNNVELKKKEPQGKGKTTKDTSNSGENRPNKSPSDEKDSEKFNLENKMENGQGKQDKLPGNGSTQNNFQNPRKDNLPESSSKENKPEKQDRFAVKDEKKLEEALDGFITSPIDKQYFKAWLKKNHMSEEHRTHISITEIKSHFAEWKNTRRPVLYHLKTFWNKVKLWFKSKTGKKVET